MINSLRTFFTHQVIQYRYDQTPDVVASRIHEILDEKRNVWSEHDIKGQFTGPDTFVMEQILLASTKYGTKSKLVGQLSAEAAGTVVTTTIRTRLFYHICFFVLITFGMGRLVISIQDYSLLSILGSLALLLIGPFLTIKLSNLSKWFITDRYRRYIDTPLRK